MNTLTKIVCYFICYLAFFNVHAATDIPLNMSTNKTITHPINIDDTQTSITFEIDQAEELAIEIVLPLDHATVSLIGPDGIVVIAANDPQIITTPGSQFQPGLPGAMVLLPAVQSPMTGSWSLVIDYPVAEYKTLIIVQVLVKTKIAFGMAIPINEYVVGESIALAALLTDEGTPLTGEKVSFEIINPNNSISKVVASDDGQIGDFKENDGIYSKLHIVEQSGQYTINATVELIYDGIAVKRQSSKKIAVVPNSIDIKKISLIPQNSSKGCTEYINQEVDIFVNVAGEYAFTNYLKTKTDKLDGGTRKILTEGDHTLSFQYSKKDLLTTFAADARLTLTPMYVIRLEPDAHILASARTQPNNVLSLADIEFCREAIEISKQLTTTALMSDDNAYIQSLTFKFPIYVDNPGSYIGSVNISASAGEKIDLVSFEQYFTKGDNYFEFTVPGKKFQQADGPYILNSLLVYTNGHSARLRELGKTQSYKKEDFIPKVKMSLPLITIGLERNNWQGDQPIIEGTKRIGGYLRSGASIAYDYEVLSAIDLSHIKGVITKSSIEVSVGESTLIAPFTQIEVFQVADQPWNMTNISYDHFCNSFTECPGWSKKIGAFDATKNHSVYTLKSDALNQLLQTWLDEPIKNNGIVFTSAPHELSYFIVIEDMKINFEYIPF